MSIFVLINLYLLHLPYIRVIVPHKDDDEAKEEEEEVVEDDNDNVSADVYYLLTSLYMS